MHVILGLDILNMPLLAATPWFLNPDQWRVILQVAAGLGFVIFVHELGHFLVAKACGVKCEKFYIGFDIYGLSFFKFKWGETEYGIGILPLGGYVKMLGQDDNPAHLAEETRRAKLNSSSADAADRAPALTHGDLPPEPVSDPHAPYDPRSYMAQSVPKRMAIISAGVIMNVIFAFVMATIAYAIGVPEAPCIVGGTVPGGAAWKAGLQPGDEITQIATVENPRFRDLQTGVSLGNVDQGIPFKIRRGSDPQSESILLFPDRSLGVPMIGITSAAQPKLVDRPGIKPTEKFSPARDARPKFEPGDTILQINDTPVQSYSDLDRAFARNVDESIEVKVQRADKPTGNDDQKAPGEIVAIKVGPAALRGIGLVMPLGPITAAQSNSPGEKAGLQVGDRIVAIDDQPVGDPLTLPDRMRRLAGKSVQLEIERKTGVDPKTQKTETLKIDVVPKAPEFTDVLQSNTPLPLTALGITCEMPPTVAAVEPGSVAAKADVQPGDQLVSMKLIAPPKRPDADEADDEAPPPSKAIEFGKKLSWPGATLYFLPQIDPDSKIEMEVKRGDKSHSVVLPTEELKNAQGEVLHSPHRGFLFAPILITHQTHSLGEAMRAGLAETRDALLLVYRFLQKIGGQIPVTMLSGPFGIIQQAGAEAQRGFSSFLIFLTLLSANLAVVNFLPIPLLDGGHMVFLLYEGIRRKPASERVIVAFTYAGLIFLLSLMLFVLLLDLQIIPRL